MKEDIIENESSHGENIVALRKVFGMKQSELADKTGIPAPQLSIYEKQRVIDDRIAKAMSKEFTADTIKNYRHENTLKYVISENNFTATGAENSKGAVIRAAAMQEVSETIDNRIINDLDKYGELWQRIVELEKKITYYQIKCEEKDSPD